jgi:hypothetical protein
MSETRRNKESEALSHLRELQSTGLYLFHGSAEPIDMLEPRQAYSHGVADGEPAICAASDLDTAIFMALNSSARKALLSEGKSCQSGYNNNGDSFYFYATPNLIALIQNGVEGNIHVISKEGFRKYHGEREMRSTSPVQPIDVVAVQSSDFRHEIHELNQIDLGVNTSDRSTLS